MKIDELKVARDHLVMCQHRLEVARAASKPDGTVEWTFRVIERRECETDVCRALDWVWGAQERSKARRDMAQSFFGIGAINAEEAREILLMRVDTGYYEEAAPIPAVFASGTMREAPKHVYFTDGRRCR